RCRSSSRAVATEESSARAVIGRRRMSWTSASPDVYPVGRALATGTILISMSATLKRLDLRGVQGDLTALLPRPEVTGEGPVEVVRAIMSDVRQGGDGA